MAFRPAIETAAASIGWPSLLLEAQVLVESSGDPFAFRFEPAFWSTYLKGTPQALPYGPLGACSFGLLQVLLTVAVEDGFSLRPEDLFDPVINLTVGCRHLDRLRRQVCQMAPATVNVVLQDGRPSDLARSVLASYNGGLRSNTVSPYRSQRYVEKVITQWERLKTDRDGALRA